MDDTAQKKFQIALNLLNVMGYFETSFLSKVFGSLLIIVNLIVLLGSVVGIINRETIAEKIEILPASLLVIGSLSSYFCTKYERKRIKQFLTSISTKQPIDDDIRLEVFQLTIKKAENVIIKFMISVDSVVLFVSILGLFAPFLPQFDYNNKNFYLIPYLFHCSENGVNRFPIKWLCVNGEKPFAFFLTNSLYAIFCIFIVHAITLWITIFCIFIRFFVRANIAVIETYLQQLKTISSEIHHSQTDKQTITTVELENNHTMKTQLVKVIKYHQYLFRTVTMIISYLEKICDIFMIPAVLIPASIIFTMQIRDESNGLWWHQVKTFGMLFVLIALYFIPNYCIQIIFDMHADIKNVVYSTPWYNQDREFRKLLIQFQILLQRPIEMKSMGSYPIGLRLFGSVMRTMYKAVNLMLAQFVGK